MHFEVLPILEAGWKWVCCGFDCRRVGRSKEGNAMAFICFIFVAVRLDVADALAVIASGCFYTLVERKAGGTSGGFVGYVFGRLFIGLGKDRVIDGEGSRKAGVVVASAIPFAAHTEVTVAVFKVAEEIGELRIGQYGSHD